MTQGAWPSIADHSCKVATLPDISPNASEEDRQRQEVVERLCQTLEKDHRKVIRDKNALHPGDQISTFMKTLGQARLVIVEQHFTHLGEEDLKLYKAMRRWHNEVGDMLAYVNDKLHPHGFDEILKDDFAGLRQMLQRHRPGRSIGR